MSNFKFSLKLMKKLQPLLKEPIVLSFQAKNNGECVVAIHLTENNPDPVVLIVVRYCMDIYYYNGPTHTARCYNLKAIMESLHYYAPELFKEKK